MPEERRKIDKGTHSGKRKQEKDSPRKGGLDDGRGKKGPPFPLPLYTIEKGLRAGKKKEEDARSRRRRGITK